MLWNYRIIRRPVEDTFLFSLHEVYYDKKGKPEMWSEPMTGEYDSAEEVVHDLASKLKDAKKQLKAGTILDAPTLPGYDPAEG